jgi:hypothetical protein
LQSTPDESLASACELFFARGYPAWEALIEERDRPKEGPNVPFST